MDPDPKRLLLHNLLINLLNGPDVYFQPPSNVQMKYPCIVYKRDGANSEFADNSPYRNSKRYQIMVIDRDPDSGIPDKVAALPLCAFDRFYTADNLNHDVFNLYY
jgi:hypothetical protein